MFLVSRTQINKRRMKNPKEIKLGRCSCSLNQSNNICCEKRSVLPEWCSFVSCACKLWHFAWQLAFLSYPCPRLSRRVRTSRTWPSPCPTATPATQSPLPNSALPMSSPLGFGWRRALVKIRARRRCTSCTHLDSWHCLLRRRSHLEEFFVTSSLLDKNFQLIWFVSKARETAYWKPANGIVCYCEKIDNTRAGSDNNWQHFVK